MLAITLALLLGFYGAFWAIVGLIVGYRMAQYHQREDR